MIRLFATCCSLAIAWSTPAFSADVTNFLAKIQTVGPDGKGHHAATDAVRQLIKQDASVLPKILTSLKHANPLAANWLRSAFESIADREIRRGNTAAVISLEQFIRDRKQDPRARHLAFEWLVRVDSAAPDRLIPGMLTDPSPDFRRDAVARLIDTASRLQIKGSVNNAVTAYQQALRGATDEDQVQAIVQPLKKLGHEVDLQRHFGFLTRWQVIGPFDNRGRIGFEAVYPPEKQINFKESYRGQLNEVQWTHVSTNDDYGLFDIAKTIKNFKGSVMYFATEFNSARQQSVDFRLGTPNAWKLWVNGKLVFGRAEYHRGTALDQYRVSTTITRGNNVILLKICQNEQTDDWAQRFQFQIRVCDASGRAILPVDPTRTSRLDSSRSQISAVQGAK